MFREGVDDEALRILESLQARGLPQALFMVLNHVSSDVVAKRFSSPLSELLPHQLLVTLCAHVSSQTLRSVAHFARTSKVCKSPREPTHPSETSTCFVHHLSSSDRFKGTLTLEPKRLKVVRQYSQDARTCSVEGACAGQ